MNCSMPGLPVHHQLPESTQTYVRWVGNAIQLSHPLSSPSAAGKNQHQGLCRWVGSSHQVAKVLEFQLLFLVCLFICFLSFSFNIRHTNEHPGLIFRMDWFNLLTIQGTLKSLQHHSSEASILQCSAFFMVHLSHPYMTTGKPMALSRRTFVDKSNVSAF